MAALLGALPLALGSGAAPNFAGAWITIIGGLLISQLLTLYTSGNLSVRSPGRAISRQRVTGPAASAE